MLQSIASQQLQWLVSRQFRSLCASPHMIVEASPSLSSSISHSVLQPHHMHSCHMFKNPHSRARKSQFVVCMASDKMKSPTEGEVMETLKSAGALLGILATLLGPAISVFLQLNTLQVKYDQIQTSVADVKTSTSNMSAKIDALGLSLGSKIDAYTITAAEGLGKLGRLEKEIDKKR